MKILLADDHAIVRDGLKRVLADTLRDVTFGEAEDTQKTIGAIAAQQWDLVILDIAMPGRGGLEVLKEIRAQRPLLPVLMLSMYPEHQYAIRALRAGAAGYVTKASAPGELLTAIEQVLSGHKFVSRALAEQMAADLASPGAEPLHETLSDRELEVLRLLAAGKTVKEIATQLFLSDNTISTYRARLLEKLRLTSNAELIRYAFENSLLP